MNIERTSKFTQNIRNIVSIIAALILGTIMAVLAFQSMGITAKAETIDGKKIWYVSTDWLSAYTDPTDEETLLTAFPKGTELEIIGVYESGSKYWQVWNGSSKSFVDSTYLKPTYELAMSVYKEPSDYIIDVPSGLGRLHTYTIWGGIRWGGDCRTLINTVNPSSNKDGFVCYGDYFGAALTTTFGRVGDMLLVVQTDGSIYPVMIADTKDQTYAHGTPANTYGHWGGKDIVEFEIYNSSAARAIYGSSGSYAGANFDFCIDYIINLGSVYSDDYYLYNVEQALTDNNLEDRFFIGIE